MTPEFDLYSNCKIANLNPTADGIEVIALTRVVLLE